MNPKDITSLMKRPWAILEPPMEHPARESRKAADKKAEETAECRRAAWS